MRLIDITRLSIKEQQANLRRTTLAVLGIAVAVGFVISLVGLGYGVRNATTDSLTQSKPLLSLNVVAGPDKQLTPMTDDTVKSFDQMNGVSAVSPILETTGRAELNSQIISSPARAGTSNLLSIQGINLTNGRLFKDNKNEIVLSSKTASLLNMKEADLLNSSVNFSFDDPSAENQSIVLATPLKVVGITDGADDIGFYLPYSAVNTPTQNQMSSIEILANNRDSLNNIQANIESKGYFVTNLVSAVDSTQSIFQWTIIALALIASVALVVAIIGLNNLITITAKERTREIGVLKSIGATQTDIRRLFMMEALSIGFWGSIIGAIFSLGINQLISSIIGHYAVRFGGIRFALFQYPAGFLIGIIVVTIILALLVSIRPARKASHIVPFDALGES